MDVVVLGSGTAVPHARRGGPAVLVREGETSLLVDAGTGTLQKLALLGVSLAALDAAAFTHLHVDHTAELASLLFALRNTGIGRTKPLPLYGGPGFRAFHRKLVRMYGAWLDPLPFPLTVEEAGERAVAVGPLGVTAFPVAHSAASVAYRIEGPGGKAVAVSGDTDVCEGIVAAARGADLAVLECSFPEGAKAAGHLVPSEAGRIARLAGVRRLVLTHFYPECEGEDIAGPCGREYGGEILLAEDLLRLTA